MPVLYLQVKDAGQLIDRYRAGAQARRYHESRNFEDFQKSKLYNKLEGRIRQMEEVAGFGITLDNLRSFLGKESAVWLFDIQELKFVAATSIPESRFAESVLAKVSSRFEERRSGTFSYSVKEGDDGAVTLAFCRFGNTLVFGNDVPSFLSIAERVRTRGQFRDEAQAVFRRAFDPDFSCGDATLFFTKDALRNTYFRTYWVFRNTADLGWIDAGLADFAETKEGWTERRWFAADPAGSVPLSAGKDLSGIASFFPEKPYYARLSAQHDPDVTSALVSTALFSNPCLAAADISSLSSLLAPGTPSAVAVGLEGWFQENLFLRWSRLCVVEMETPSSLDIQKIQQFLAGCVRKRLVAGGGDSLIPSGVSSHSKTPVWYIEPPCAPRSGAAACLAGRYLILSRDRTTVEKALACGERPLRASQATSVFITADIDRIRQDCLKTVGFLASGSGWESEDSPSFFSENLPSLAEWASSVKRMTVSRQVHSGLICETVSYLRAP